MRYLYTCFKCQEVEHTFFGGMSQIRLVDGRPSLCDNMNCPDAGASGKSVVSVSVGSKIPLVKSRRSSFSSEALSIGMETFHRSTAMADRRSNVGLFFL